MVSCVNQKVQVYPAPLIHFKIMGEHQVCQSYPQKKRVAPPEKKATLRALVNTAGYTVVYIVGMSLKSFSTISMSETQYLNCPFCGDHCILAKPGKVHCPMCYSE